MSTMEDIIVSANSVAVVGWEEGTAGQVHSWLEKATKYQIACFINPADEPLEIDPSRISRTAKQFSYPNKDSFKGRPLINGYQWSDALLALGIRKILVTTDDPYLRLEHIDQARQADLELISAIHPTALVMEDAILACNIILHARSIVGYRAEIGSGVIVNTNAQIDHHCVVGECVTIDPGVILAGNVTIGRFAKIHTGAVIKNRIEIGDGAITGAGAVVINDVPCNSTVVGVPARVIKQNGVSMETEDINK